MEQTVTQFQTFILIFLSDGSGSFGYLKSTEWSWGNNIHTVLTWCSLLPREFTGKGFELVLQDLSTRDRAPEVKWEQMNRPLWDQGSCHDSIYKWEKKEALPEGQFRALSFCCDLPSGGNCLSRGGYKTDDSHTGVH